MYKPVLLLAAIISALFPAHRLCAAPLSWDTCVAEARAHNRNLLAAEHDYRAAQFRIDSASGASYPQLSVDLDASRSSSGASGDLQILHSGDGTAASPGSDAGPGNTMSAALSLRQSIFSGFRIEAEIESARAQAEVSRADLDIARARVSYDLKSAYASLLYSQDSVQLARSIMDRREENLALVELRYQNGNENKGSYLLSRAALADASLGSLQAENLIHSSRQQLAAVLGRESAEDLQVSGEVPATAAPANPPFEKLLSGIPEDRRALALKKIADAGLKAAEAPYYPSVDVSGQSAYRDQGTGLAGKDSWRFGIQVSYPLFTGWSDLYNRKSAQENLNSAVSQRIATAQQLRSRLRSAWTAYAEAVQRVEVNREFVDAAANRAEIARARYNNGLLSFEDWDVIENDLITRQKNLLLSQRDRVVAEAAWEQAQGKGVFQ